jgi:hypothetical protein
MSKIVVNFILTGALAAKTVKLGRYAFNDGKCSINGTPEDVAQHARFLERNWHAYPEGHAALNQQQEQDNGQRNLQTNPQSNEQPPLHGGSEPNGKGIDAGDAADAGQDDATGEAGQTGLLPQGNGQQAGVTHHGDPKIAKAVLSLDPNDDKAWNKDGRPAMQAVEALYGCAGITRADVEAAVPGWTREQAKVQAGQ